MRGGARSAIIATGSAATPAAQRETVCGVVRVVMSVPPFCPAGRVNRMGRERLNHSPTPSRVRVLSERACPTRRRLRRPLSVFCRGPQAYVVQCAGGRWPPSATVRPCFSARSRLRVPSRAMRTTRRRARPPAAASRRKRCGGGRVRRGSSVPQRAPAGHAQTGPGGSAFRKDTRGVLECK